MNWKKIKNHKRFPLALFFLLYLGVTFFTYKDYGITWDEYDSYVHAGNYIKHFFLKNTEEQEQKEVYSLEQAAHNYLYPALARVFTPRQLAAEKLHLFNMIFALLVFTAIFEILLDALQNCWWAFMGPAALYLTLRFSGDIPADPKDMPFAVLYTLSLATFYFYRGRDKNKLFGDLTVGTLIGLTTCVRILGVTLLPVFVFGRFWDLRQTSPNGKGFSFSKWLKEETPGWILVFFVSQFWMMALWPYLGRNYFGSILTIFRISKDFYWSGPMAFMGRTVYASERLWYYLPVWFGVSLPLFVLAFFLLSIWLFRRMKNKSVQRLYFLFSAALFLNLLICLVLKPILYNGLRLYLFLVPIIVVLAVLGMFEFWEGFKSKAMRWATGFLVAINIGFILIQWTQLYPFQYLYLNEWVGGVRTGGLKYDLDYWGASLKEASQWLIFQEIKDPRKIYRVRTSACNWQQTYYFPPNVYGDTDMQNADYRIVLSYIGIIRPDEFTLTPDLKKKIIHVVEREGVPLAYVFKLK